MFNFHSNFTALSFVELGRHLLQKEEVYFLLSCQFNQDCLEEFFGKQRSRGRYNDNPSVQQYMENCNSIRLMAALTLENKRLNTHMQDEDYTWAPLRRKRRRTNST